MKEGMIYICLPGNNLPRLQGFPQVRLDIFMSYVVANLGLHCELPSKDFLIRKTADEKECD